MLRIHAPVSYIPATPPPAIERCDTPKPQPTSEPCVDETPRATRTGLRRLKAQRVRDLCLRHGVDAAGPKDALIERLLKARIPE